MKKVLTAIAAVVIAGTVNADIFVNWSGPSGFVQNDGTTPIVPDPTTALVQLLYSVDGSFDAADIGGTAGSDSVLSQQLISEVLTGNPYGAQFSFVYTAPFQAGFLAVRVFDGGTSSGVVPAGTWYFTGPAVATLNNSGGANPPDPVRAGLAGTGPGPFGTYILNQQVVPEPMSIAFLGLGAVIAAARRIRKA